ncbi:MAG: hypothetical protein K1X71_09490 [Pirellulales bacterium]|nr:hypothetical protein [Pirellulales bacterium]
MFARIACVACAIGCLTAASLSAQERPAVNVDRLRADATAQHAELLALAKQDLASARGSLARCKKGKIDTTIQTAHFIPDLAESKIVFRSRGDRLNAVRLFAAEVDVIEKEIAAAQVGKRKLVPCLREPLEAGQAGRFGSRAQVVQVIDDRQLLAEIHTQPDSEPFRERRLVYLSGVDAAGVSDGDMMPLTGRDDVWQCVGTKTYQTALGASNTVPQLRPLTEEQISELRDLLAN